MQGLEPGALNFNDAIVQESLANQPTAEMLAEVRVFNWSAALCLSCRSGQAKKALRNPISIIFGCTARRRCTQLWRRHCKRCLR